MAQQPQHGDGNFNLLYKIADNTYDISQGAGATGATGLTGDTGATGLIGTTGATGIAGNNGATGATGVVGATGLEGATGVVGATGLEGATGVTGATGLTGATGVGTQGSTGATGIQGPTPWSLPATVYDNGTSYNLGAAVTYLGGYYYRTGNPLNPGYPPEPGVINASWTPVADGGATGLLGATGLDGSTGATGIEGATGLTGATGEVGATGLQGATGLGGSTGATGLEGATGNLGITGATGVQGIEGLVGATGSTGIQGATGVTGSTGISPDTSTFVQKSGDTMTGKLTLPASTTASAGINLGVGAIPTSPVVGDLIATNNRLYFQESPTTQRIIAYTNTSNGFNNVQTIDANTTTTLLRVTQRGTGEAFRVEDETTPDATAFVISNSGRVGIGVTPDASVCLSLDSTGVKFNDGTIQTTAATGSGTVTSVSATSPITSTGGATPVISTSMATNKLLGRSTAGIGVAEEISIGTGLSLTAGTLSNTGVLSDTAAAQGGTQLLNMVQITQAAYSAIVTPNANTLYIIVA